MAELPSGTVTFLFTDLVSSTRLWEEQPEAMRAALARHDRLLTEAVEARGGARIKGTGDGLHAVFPSAQAAVAAAVDAQLAMGAEDWGPIGRLRVRMGLHTGVAEQRDGDYFGPVLNRAARLMSVGHGGQVLCSQATADLFRDSMAGSIDLVDLGDHQLRDLSRPERIFQLVGEGLESEFAPLRSLGRPRGNVVLPSTSFLGREAEMGEVAALVGISPLVTLLGVGGVGKTRLALQVASEVAPDFAGGAWFCDLASVADEEGVGLALASALGVVPRGGLPVVEAVLEFLGAKQLLVVLDNCEHLIDGVAAFAEEAGARCPELRLLATSREALALAGERLWPVRPLPVPKDAADVAEAFVSAPVRLFVDRVQMVRPGFQLESGNLGAVLEICRHLDGIPLAIELAAARAKSLSAGEIAERLDRRFALLSGSRRRGVSRHETLRAAVDWSYDLLEQPERDVLAGVAVFSGGFTLDAAEQVAARPGERDALDLLERLVDKSLLTVEDSHGSTRYRLLETIRQYALERLDAADETAAARDRHLAYFVEFAEAAGRGLRTADEALWDRRAALEAENVRTALGWAIETEAVGIALRLVNAFSRQTIAAVHNRFLTGMAEAALELPGAPGFSLYPSALAVGSEFARINGDYDHAIELAEEALRRADETDPARWLAEVALGHIALWTARDDPVEHFAQAVTVGRANANDGDIAQAQGLMATGLSFHGMEQLDEARAEAEEAFQLAQKTECPSLIKGACFTLGYILVLSGDPSARKWLERSLETRGNTFYASGSLSMLALHHVRHGTPAQALDALDAAVREALEYRADRSVASTTLDLAIPVFVRYGDPVTAAELRAAIERGALPRLRRAGVAEQRRNAGFAALDRNLTRDELEAAETRATAMGYDEMLEHTLARIQELRTRFASDTTRSQTHRKSPT